MPTNLLLTAGNAQFTANWGASAGAGTYVIQYDVNTRPTNELQVAVFVRPGTVTSKTITSDTNLTISNGTTYRARIRACAGMATSGSTCSAYSATTTVTPTATPQIGFAATAYSVNEGDGVTLTVSIAPQLTSASSVFVSATSPFSADDDSDYTLTGLTGSRGSRTLTLPANASTATFTFTALADGATESAETASWVLSRTSEDTPYELPIPSRKTTITITSTPQVGFAATAYSVNEGDGVTLTVSIAPQLTTASSVFVSATSPFSADDDSDYTLTGLTGSRGSRTLTLPANASTATFTFTALADGATESAETASWVLSRTSEDTPYELPIPSRKTTITITSTPQVGFAATAYSVNEGDGVTLTVSIAPQLTTASSVFVSATSPFSADDDSDYTLTGLTGSRGSRTLTLPANASTATFTFTALADGATESAETASWVLSRTSEDTPYELPIPSRKTTITIADTSMTPTTPAYTLRRDRPQRA